jgi:putative Mg2+ transporter-C (MgtC) family protein
MDFVWQEVLAGLGDWRQLVRVLLRLVFASLLGAVMGYERLREHRAAGLRTHMLVALGAAMFTLIPLEYNRMDVRDLSRVIQGVATGIGFLGAGTILKLSEEHRIEGLTTAASIWVTAAAGMGVGAGWWGPALGGVLLGWFILFGLHNLERRLRGKDGGPS